MILKVLNAAGLNAKEDALLRTCAAAIMIIAATRTEERMPAEKPFADKEEKRKKGSGLEFK